MAKTYITILEGEFDNLLKTDKGWVKEEYCGEYVYSYTPKKNADVRIKVYSSISPSGLSKTCGKDAIRVAAVNVKTNKGILKSKRVNRVEGWDTRLKQRVLETINNIW